MGDKKTIQLNPNFLLGKKSNKTEKKRKKKETLQSLVKPNNIKKSLINKIKSFHNKEKNKNNNNLKTESNNKDSFLDNLNYLDNIIKSRKEKKKLKKERKKQRTLKRQLNRQLFSQENYHQSTNHPVPNLNEATSPFKKPLINQDIKVDIPKSSDRKINNLENISNITTNKESVTINGTNNKYNHDIRERNINEKTTNVAINNNPIKIPSFSNYNTTQKEPPYGCLKGGNKPTYSQYKRTIKKSETNSDIHPNIQSKLAFIDTPPEPNLFNRQSKLNNLKDILATPKKEKTSIMKKQKIRKTIKLYKLGKIKNKVSVLVKSGLTRKKVKDEHKILKETCLSDVKKYLRKHNLIKMGSSAPEDVLRNMYEDSYLSGKVFNKNPENLLHNYLNDEENFS
tara:strand:- start:1388 stop:2578 length:1191 start_codon:yes stop_codon:yes gene_type:complete